MKFTSLYLLFLAAPFLAKAEEITLFSHRHYEADDALYAQFTEKTGIKVNVVKASADELIERLKAEAETTKADVFMTADAGRLVRAKAEGVLQPANSTQLDERIPSQFRDPEGQWFGLTQRARILAYAPDRVKDGELTTYEDLADLKWRGRILARSSSNIYNQSLLASMIAAHGEEKAKAWAKGVRENMARPPQGSDRDQMRAVSAGLGDVAIVNTYYLGLLIESTDEKDQKVGKEMSLFFPNQADRGTHVNISGAGITKHAKNPDGARKFLEFLAMDEAQGTFPAATYEYPVVPGVEWSPLQKSWGEFQADPLNLAKLGELNETAVRIFNEVGWE